MNGALAFSEQDISVAFSISSDPTVAVVASISVRSYKVLRIISYIMILCILTANFQASDIAR